MGGSGSGRHGSRAVIECGLTIDLRRLRQQGHFRGGTCAFGRSIHWNLGNGGGASVRFAYDASEAPTWFRISYNVTSDGRPSVIDDEFRLEALPQPFGGRRWFFVCPGTGARVQTLHCPPGATRFRSRKVYGSQVRYLSQGLSSGDRWHRRADKLSKRMLAAGPPDWREQHADWEYPPKPPGMRWATYNRAFELWEDLQGASDALAVDRVMRIVSRT